MRKYTHLLAILLLLLVLVACAGEESESEAEADPGTYKAEATAEPEEERSKDEGGFFGGLFKPPEPRTVYAKVSALEGENSYILYQEDWVYHGYDFLPCCLPDHKVEIYSRYDTEDYDGDPITFYEYRALEEEAIDRVSVTYKTNATYMPLALPQLENNQRIETSNSFYVVFQEEDGDFTTTIDLSLEEWQQINPDGYYALNVVGSRVNGYDEIEPNNKTEG